MTDGERISINPPGPKLPDRFLRFFNDPGDKVGVAFNLEDDQHIVIMPHRDWCTLMEHWVAVYWRGDGDVGGEASSGTGGAQEEADAGTEDQGGIPQAGG